MSSSRPHRVIRGLRWARMCAWPASIPHSRPRSGSAKWHGAKYEQKLGKALGSSAVCAQWFEFEDANGHGFCQPDVLLRMGQGSVAILEAKYTWVPEGHTQVSELYAPVVEAALGRPAFGLVVCKKLSPQVEGRAHVVADLASALSLAQRAKGPVALHWLGESPALLSFDPWLRAA